MDHLKLLKYVFLCIKTALTEPIDPVRFGFVPLGAVGAVILPRESLCLDE